MDISIINTYYDKNKNELDNLFNLIENKIDGRICHNSILLISPNKKLVPSPNCPENPPN